MEPMLAQSYFPAVGGFPLDAQPKLNGLRCLVRADDLVLRSRNGQTYRLPQITEQLGRVLPPGATGDGELYVHGVPLQRIVSLATRQQIESATLEFHVFDLLAGDWRTRSWRQRRADLEALMRVARHAGCDRIRFVESMTADSREDAERLHDEFVAAGYEGAVLRAPDAPYATGSRSAALLKYKRFDDAEFEIVGATSARGTDSGCVIWKCLTETGRTFEVVPAWPDYERRVPGVNSTAAGTACRLSPSFSCRWSTPV